MSYLPLLALMEDQPRKTFLANDSVLKPLKPFSRGIMTVMGAQLSQLQEPAINRNAFPSFVSANSR